MSEWYEAEDDSISLDEKEKQVNIWVKQNYFGSVYVTLTFDQVKEINDEIEAIK